MSTPASADRQTTLVIKLGGELIEQAADRDAFAAFVGRIAADRPVAIVHGGGRAIDADLARRGLRPHKVDGLRVTDASTLEAVVAVLAGSANTELVAALVGAGLHAVGLSGVDAGLARAPRAAAHRTAAGETVDLGLVGDPARIDPALVDLLLTHGYVPVLASLGLDDRGSQILNVNADVMAARLAAALGADLVIAGATAGVFDEHGRSIAHLDEAAIEVLISSGTATAGMIAKLAACRAALEAGVRHIHIVDGRGWGRAHGIGDLPGTSLSKAHEAIDSTSRSHALAGGAR